MNKSHIELRAQELRKELGGTIFSFPIVEEDPHSKYAVAVYMGRNNFRIYPNPLTIEEASAGIIATLEAFKENGFDHDYDRNVRLVSYQAQIDAPNLTMRRLKKANVSKPLFEEGIDLLRKSGDEEVMFSGRGLLKWTYIEMIDNKNAKAIQFMDEYYKLLAMRKYGKTAAAIRQEVRRKTKEQGIEWIERTFKQFISDGREIINIMNMLKER
ncbi:hypothetical protein [Paenibacillus campinasensis]|uniref:Uncharacterized protein n=1 Tax=Paenibacillus campinasensis TaxID=66347 RepID=A0A268EKP0_9BACL|nr:hypothetical protein [Paenibacillus campinasensis]PAD73696.1 hypothetical protein CHH67_19875 [Paenibacillus campinasensis]